jgi:fructosamine-3-kinase
MTDARLPWDVIERNIGAMLGAEFRVDQVFPVGGGCINQCYQLCGNRGSYFVKTNHAAALSMFDAEAAALRELAHARTLRVPAPVCCGAAGDLAFLVLEYIELRRPTPACARRLGTRLAQMHRTTSEYFGWCRDNTIGSTPQINTPHSDWVSFWVQCRMRPQFALAGQNGFADPLSDRSERLMADCGRLFRGHAPPPSLLHGDMWSGNFAADEAGEPVVFDPAIYYGDREADLAMTELFGGFSSEFYLAYRETWPIADGYQIRKRLYQLYHLVNHLNLFGEGYLRQVELCLDELLAELR